MALKKTAEYNLPGVLSEIKKGIRKPVYLIFGDDSYMVETGANKITDALSSEAEKSVEVEIVDGETVGPLQTMESMTMDSLFCDRKIMRVNHCRWMAAQNTAKNLVAKSKSYYDKKNPAEALRVFLEFLGSTQWDLEELKDGGWNKIPDDEWKKQVNMEKDSGLDKWFGDMISAAVSENQFPRPSAQGTEMLENAMASGKFSGNCLVMSAESVDQRRTLFKAIAAYGVLIEFASAKNWEQEKVLQQQASETLGASGKSIDHDAFLSLVDKSGFNRRALNNEIEKLINYVGGRKKITKTDVETVTARTSQDSIFDLTDAVSSKDTARSLGCLNELFLSREEPIWILSMIAREIHLLLQARIWLDGQDDSKLPHNMDFNSFRSRVLPLIQLKKEEKGKLEFYSAHPYRMWIYLSRASKFITEELTEDLPKLLEADKKLKSRNPERIVLEELLIELCRNKAS